MLSHDGVHAAGNVRATDRFRVGSVTKTFVAAAVLQLVAERRLSLDEPVPEAGGIPLRRLLNHTSGIYNHSDDPRVFEHGLLTQWQPEELVAISREHPPYFAPGAGFHYSNTNYVILGGRPAGRAARARWTPAARTAYEESPRVRGAPARLTRRAGASCALVSDRARSRPVLPRAAAQPARPVHEDPGPYGYGLFKVQASCGWFWGHDGVVPGYMAQAYTDGKRSAVVLVTGDERTERQNAAINRAIDRALCS